MSCVLYCIAVALLGVCPMMLLLHPPPPHPFSFLPLPQDKYNRTPLHEAARDGHANVAEVLVKAGADVNAKVCGGLYFLDMSVGISETCTMCPGSASVMFWHYWRSGLCFCGFCGV